MKLFLLSYLLILFVLLVNANDDDTDDDNGNGSGEESCSVTGCDDHLVCNEITDICECADGKVEKHRETSEDSDEKECVEKQGLSSYNYKNRVINDDSDYSYTSELDDVNSETFRNYSKAWCSDIDTIFESSVISDLYVGCEVNEFREGSVIVDYLVHSQFSTRYNLSQDPSIITEILRNATSKPEENCTELVNVEECYLLGRFILDKNTRNIEANKDFDECAKQRLHGCHSNATCFNTFSSYDCQCNSGFAGNGLTCTAIPKVKVNSCMERLYYIFIFVNTILLATLIVIIAVCISTKRKADYVSIDIGDYIMHHSTYRKY